MKRLITLALLLFITVPVYAVDIDKDPTDGYIDVSVGGTGGGTKRSARDSLGITKILASLQDQINSVQNGDDPDTEPDAIDFSYPTDITPSSGMICSDTVTLTGTTASTTFVVAGDAGAVAYVPASSGTTPWAMDTIWDSPTIAPGEDFKLCVDASDLPHTTTSARVTIGGVTSLFYVTTGSTQITDFIARTVKVVTMGDSAGSAIFGIYKDGALVGNTYSVTTGSSCSDYPYCISEAVLKSPVSISDGSTYSLAVINDPSITIATHNSNSANGANPTDLLSGVNQADSGDLIAELPDASYVSSSEMYIAAVNASGQVLIGPDEDIETFTVPFSPAEDDTITWNVAPYSRHTEVTDSLDYIPNPLGSYSIIATVNSGAT